MIILKDATAIQKMKVAGKLLAEMFNDLEFVLKESISTLDVDTWIAQWLRKHDLTSKSQGYMGYRHVSCISVNDEVVHGIPRIDNKLVAGDLIKIDVCASWSGYSADMARCFFVDNIFTPEAKLLVDTAYSSLNKGIEQAIVGNRLSDISAAIQKEVEAAGFGVVRDFAGHGIGKKMHEDPEILNFGLPGNGPLIKAGMTFALEPMITMGDYSVHIAHDGWTAKTKDKSLAAHVEDTIVVTENGPEIITRY